MNEPINLVPSSYGWCDGYYYYYIFLNDVWGVPTNEELSKKLWFSDILDMYTLIISEYFCWWNFTLFRQEAPQLILFRCDCAQAKSFKSAPMYWIFVVGIASLGVSF